MKDIQQLIKKNSQEGRYEDIFPKTFIDAVLDKESGITLTDILAMFNMLFLSYNGSRSQTRLQVPSSLRREGLWVTYVLYDKTVVTEWYSAEAIDDTTFGDSANWRDGSNALVGDISISSDGYWVINGEVTNIKAQGEAGITPILRVGSNNHLQVSYTNGSSYVDVSSNPVFTQFRVSNNKLQQSTDLGESWSNISEELAYKFRESGNKIQMSKDLGNTWEDVSDYIAAWFRFTGTTGSSQADNVGKIQISRDNGATWSDLSGEFTNSLHIKGYVATVDALPSTAVQGDIYGVGPTYDPSDTEHTNPIYQLYVKNSTGWVNNGRFTSIAAGVVQETGNSETAVMSQDSVTKLTISPRISIEPSISIRIDANSDGTVTLGKNFNANHYIEATLPNGTNVVWYPTASTNTYNIPQRGKLLWNLSTNTMRTVDNKTAILNEEVVLLSRNAFQENKEDPSPKTTFYNVLKGYTGGLLLPYIVTQLYERGSAWTSIGTCMISFGGDGTVKISDGWYLFYKYDGTSTLCNIATSQTFNLANYKQLVFNYYDNAFRVVNEYEQLSDKDILLLRYSSGVKKEQEANRGSIFGYSDGIWLTKIWDEYRLSQTAMVSPSPSCQLNVKLDGTVTLNNRDVAAQNSWYEFNLENGQRPLLYITDDNNTHVVPNLGALVYNRWDNSVRVITMVDNTNDLGSHDIILLKRGTPVMSTPAYSSYSGNSLWGFVDGKLYPFIERALIISGNAYQCVSTAKISVDNTGLVNIGTGIHIFYRFDSSYRVINATGQSFTVPNYGKLVFNFNDNAIKTLGEFDDLSEFDVLLLKRGVANSADSVDSWVGGLWMNKLLATKSVDISGIEQQIASINTEINDLQEQIASISPTVGFADLPVSDGSDIQVGYAYINSSDNTIRVKR